MNRRALTLLVGLLLVPLGCGSPTGPTLQPNESCSGQPANAVATFEDAGLEDAVSDAVERTRPPVGFLETRDRLDLTCGRVSGLTLLDGHGSDRIGSLLGIQNLTSLQVLRLIGNSITDISPLSGLTSLTRLELVSDQITDISPLSGLTSLTHLFLNENSITDISALSGLTSLESIDLSNNSITDISALSGLTSLTSLTLGNNPDLSNIQPLLDNTGLGETAQVFLGGTNVSCTDVAALEAKGVDVGSDCP